LVNYNFALGACELPWPILGLAEIRQTQYSQETKNNLCHSITFINTVFRNWSLAYIVLGVAAGLAAAPLPNLMAIPPPRPN
jgi:hypothetical protein